MVCWFSGIVDQVLFFEYLKADLNPVIDSFKRESLG